MNWLENLEKDGFAVLPFSLNQDNLQEICKLFYRFHKPSDESFFTSFNLSSSQDKLEIDSELKRILDPIIHPHFVNYESLVANFVVKYVGETGLLPLHRDWSVVDERKFQSVSIWIPLIDISEKNGILGFVQGSHKKASWDRGPSNINTLFPSGLDEEVLFQPMNKGQIISFFPSTLHTSKANLSNEVRIALTLVLVPKNAEKLHFYYPKEKSSIIQVYHVEKDFFLNYELGQKPINKVSYVIFNTKRIKFPFSLKYLKWLK